MNAIVYGNEDLPQGVIYILKNLNNKININSQNRLHPFYMIYISDDGQVVMDHLEPKNLLDSFRLLCKDKIESIKKLCKKFNKETKDGKDMEVYSDLLEEAIKSIMEVKEDDDLDSFFSGKEMSFLSEKIEGLDDF